MKLHLVLVALVALSYCSIECQALNRKKRSDEDIGNLWNELVQETRKARIAFEKYHENVQKNQSNERPAPSTDDDYEDKPPQQQPPVTTTTTSPPTKGKPADSNPTTTTKNPAAAPPTEQPPEEK